MAFKLAFIGSHGVGKTTLVYGLAARLKARDHALEVVVEVARRCPLPLNEDTSLAAQSWILHTQMADELVAEERYPIVICDRSVLDNYVYLMLAEGAQAHLERLVEHWMATYGLLVHVPIVEGPLTADGIRSTDAAFQATIESRLLGELERRGLDYLDLSDSDRASWLDVVERAVLPRLGPLQLALPGDEA